jgi:hypothetical protein
MVTAQLSPTRRKAIARWARAQLARRSLAKFAQQAVAAGVVEGTPRLEWGPHLEAHAWDLQMQFESWIVANGPDPGTAEFAEWASERWEMIARQKAAWERTGAVWEDRQPAPWLRYVLVQNTIDNLPPSCWKSSMAMICANAWIWLWDPTFSFGALSGMDANVGRDSRATRELIRSDWYRETFEITWTDNDLDDKTGEPASVGIRRDMDAIEAWGTTAGGKRISRTATRGLTGVHVDCILYDDPDDADNVYSEAERLKPQNRWTRVIENRINDERRSIRRMMQQVVHPEGMTWYLRSLSRWSPQTPTGWAQFCIPAEFGFGPSDAPAETPWGWKDWRSEKGETIHPRLSAGVLAVIKTKHSAYEAQYNQNAEAVGDGMIARTDVRFFVWEHEARTVGLLKARPQECIPRNKLPPVIIKPSDLRDTTLSVDAANSLNPKPGAKISAVGLVVGACSRTNDDRFILDDQTRILGVSATYRAVFDVLAKWPIERVLVELKALGAGVIEELELAIRRGWFLDNETDEKIELLGPDGRRVRCEVEQVKVAPGEDKVQRAHGMLPSWEAHQMHVHDGAEWLYPRSDEATRRTVDDGYIGEICGFPRSRKSDRVDATSQFVARYRDTSDPREEWRAMRRLALVGGRR